ncbi:MAG: hypothetical protein ACLFPW_10010 [Spirochaetaceae bacterium]
MLARAHNRRRPRAIGNTEVNGDFDLGELVALLDSLDRSHCFGLVALKAELRRLGESHMDGWGECDWIDEMLAPGSGCG